MTDYALRTTDIKNDLVYVCSNQAAGLKNGKKLIGLTVRRLFGVMDPKWCPNFGYLFATEVLPFINDHVEANVGGSDHWTVLENYKNKTSLTDTRFDSTSWGRGYSCGTITTSLIWIEAASLNPEKGPIVETFWQYVQHGFPWQDWTMCYKIWSFMN